MEKINGVLDGNVEEQTRILKELFGLTPDQSFQDIEENNDQTAQ